MYRRNSGGGVFVVGRQRVMPGRTKPAPLGGAVAGHRRARIVTRDQVDDLRALAGMIRAQVENDHLDTNLRDDIDHLKMAVDELARMLRNASMKVSAHTLAAGP